jgi:hypothetical protein
LKKTAEKNYFKVRFGYVLAISGIGFAGWLLCSAKWKELQSIGICLGIGILCYFAFGAFKDRSSKKQVQ